MVDGGVNAKLYTDNLLYIASNSFYIMVLHLLQKFQNVRMEEEV